MRGGTDRLSGSRPRHEGAPGTRRILLLARGRPLDIGGTSQRRACTLRPARFSRRLVGRSRSCQSLTSHPDVRSGGFRLRLWPAGTKAGKIPLPFTRGRSGSPESSANLRVASRNFSADFVFRRRYHASRWHPGRRQPLPCGLRAGGHLRTGRRDEPLP